MLLGTTDTTPPPVLRLAAAPARKAFGVTKCNGCGKLFPLSVTSLPSLRTASAMEGASVRRRWLHSSTLSSWYNTRVRALVPDMSSSTWSVPDMA
eukprot:3938348-Rhodomonas_salina.1